MFNAFIWMFKKEKFVKHFLYLFFFTFFALALTVLSLNKVLPQNNYLYLLKYLPLLLFLMLMGYFWDLSGEIVDREWDIEADSVYSKKTKVLYNFEMPDLNFFKLFWRGFSSVVANLLIPVPYLLLVYISTSTGHYDALPEWVKIFSLGLFLSFAPALCWNYAKTNSVFATLNIAKAVSVMGNYTLRYVCIVLLWTILIGINYYFDSMLYQYYTMFHKFDLISILITMAIIFLFAIKTIYFIFVYAYILGSLTPASEF